MDGISRSRGWDKKIPHCVLPMEQLVLSNKWARIFYPISEGFLIICRQNVCRKAILMCLIPILVEVVHVYGGIICSTTLFKGLARIHEVKEVPIHKDLIPRMCLTW